MQILNIGGTRLFYHNLTNSDRFLPTSYLTLVYEYAIIPVIKSEQMNKFENFLKEKQGILGAVGATLGTLMFLSLIEILISNIKGETNLYIQPIFTALNCLCWSLYGHSKKDKFIFVPNTIGLILGTITALSVMF